MSSNAGWTSPASAGAAAKRARFTPAHQPDAGDRKVGVTQPHAGKYLTILEHLEPPISHRHLPLNEFAAEDTGCERKSETSANQRRGGSITVNMAWSHYAEHRVAPLR